MHFPCLQIPLVFFDYKSNKMELLDKKNKLKFYLLDRILKYRLVAINNIKLKFIN